MAPFHPLRDETRVFAARVLAAVAVFCVIALALLSGSSAGPLASAEAQDPKGNAYGQAEGATPRGNGVLGGGGAKQDPSDPVAPEVQQPTTESAPVPAPTGSIDPTNGGGKGANSGAAAPAPTGATKGNGERERERQRRLRPGGRDARERPRDCSCSGTGLGCARHGKPGRPRLPVQPAH